MEISIIVPIYNAEKHLTHCVESILENTYTDYELILIDDKSVDSSRVICKQYAQKDRRINFYTNERNMGVAATRNRGIELAKGKYIMFCDNDDIVSPHWIEHLLEWTNRYDNILPISSICYIPRFCTQKKLSSVHTKVYNKHKYYFFNQLGIAGYIWNTIYRKDIIIQHDIRFQSRREIGDINEDLIFSLDYLKHIDNIIYTGYTDYCHTKNDTNHSTYTDQNFYFYKYQEKYNLWKNYILSNKYEEQHKDLEFLATETLYHFLHALRIYPQKGKQQIEFYKKVISSKEIKDVLSWNDPSKENRIIQYLLKRELYLLVWFLFKLSH